jgi:hypothetical protein
MIRPVARPPVLLSTAWSSCLSLCAGLLLAGCGSTETHALMFRTPPPGAGSSGHEAVLFVETVPRRPFAEVGLIQAIGTGNQAHTPEVLAALREEGRRRGCDAIVLARAASGAVSAHAAGMCVLWTE